jgi:hypothetical protein
MIWAEVGEVAVGTALVTISAGVIAIVTRIEATSRQVEQKALAPPTVAFT